MGTAGIIFGIIAALWLAYLVPTFVNNRDDPGADELDSSDRFAESMRIIRRGTDAISPTEFACEVSTPLMRRAAHREVRRAHSTAAFRRALGALVLLVVMLGLVVASIVGVMPLASAGVAFVALIGWLGLCRFSTHTLNRALDARVAEIDANWAEPTVSFEIPEELREIGDGDEEWSIEVASPEAGVDGSLWDPIPVTSSAYAGKRLAARTVRTIDLAAPADSLPPVAERPEADTTDGGDLGLAAGA